jgi:hypothetical protein
LILERVVAYSEAGDVERAVDVCQRALAVWEEVDGMGDALGQFEELATVLERS